MAHYTMSNFNPSKYGLISKPAKTRTALQLPDEEVLSAYGTNRLAKIEEEKLLFTIGETLHGKAANLSKQIKSIITESGLRPITEPTTNGRLREEKIYVGIDLNESPSPLVDEVLPRIIKTVKECA